MRISRKTKFVILGGSISFVFLCCSTWRLSNLGMTSDANKAQQHAATKIPNNLFLTYEFDLLTTHATLTDEETSLRDNAFQTMKKMPSLHVAFLSDVDCILEIGSLPERLRYNLTYQFSVAQRGMIKADICRGAALYNHGGWYLDVDVEPIYPLEGLTARLSSRHELLTVTPAWEPDKSIFQAIMASTRRSSIVLKYLEIFASSQYDLSKNGTQNTGTYFLFQAIRDADPSKVYFMKEVRLAQFPYAKFNLRATHLGYWCDNIVYDAVRRDVWFYSRIPGSRMCQKKNRPPTRKT